MPVVKSTYQVPWGFSNGHLQSIYPALGRRVEPIAWTRERIATPDGDFLDLDQAGAGGGPRGNLVPRPRGQCESAVYSRHGARVAETGVGRGGVELPGMQW